MNVKYLAFALFLFIFSAQTAFAQNDNAEVDVQVFESVLNTAKWANFKYMDQLSAAKKGDYKATLALLEFSGTVDGREALDHSVTLLELLYSGGDLPFAAAVHAAKPKLVKVLLDRLQLAQGRTKKEDLRKPIAEWAPLTWDVLNGKPFIPKLNSGAEKPSADSNAPDAKAAAIPANVSKMNTTSDFSGAVPEMQTQEKPKGKQ